MTARSHVAGSITCHFVFFRVRGREEYRDSWWAEEAVDIKYLLAQLRIFDKKFSVAGIAGSRIFPRDPLAIVWPAVVLMAGHKRVLGRQPVSNQDQYIFDSRHEIKGHEN